MRLLLDAGAFVALERADRVLGALLVDAAQQQVPVLTSAGAVAQVWRGGPRQARLARLLAGVESIGIAPDDARPLGELLGRSGTVDVVDAHIALLARPGDVILTSDPKDLAHLMAVREVRVRIRRV
ncbi:hypothetical protein ACQEVB_01500 [Pseudonocardia sp. CA-107938]|uniref:hypothetical protein n=1 Tax=Pseudonocardia sp. CA-107938 TaxID=3240021 RepID=UPI003D8EAD80